MATTEQDAFKPTMQEIVVEKDKLTEILRENRKAHRKVFLEALDGYEKAVVKELADRLKSAKAGNRNAWKMLSIVEPIDHTDDYDRVIKMLELSVHDQIHLSEHEFAQYVMDDWAWKHQFAATTASYTS